LKQLTFALALASSLPPLLPKEKPQLTVLFTLIEVIQISPNSFNLSALKSRANNHQFIKTLNL
jgi:hypothetical protein